MAAGRGKEIAIAIVGLVAFAAILVRFGMLRHAETSNPPAQVAAPAVAPAPASTAAEPPKDAAAPAASAQQPQTPAAPATQQQAAVAPPPAAPEPPAAPAPAAAPPLAVPPPAPARVELPRPTFDTVRVEPDGASVVAGRGAPGTKVELLRNGIVHDTLSIDSSGAFAFVPPPLPTGTSEVTLRLIGPDGTSSISAQSITVVVSEGRRDAPLVMRSEPDKPTVILSQPAPAAPVQAQAQAQPPAQVQAQAQAQAQVQTPAQPQAQAPAAPSTPATPAPAAAPAPAAPAPPAPRRALRVVSVEAEEGGKLFVTGQGEAGANVRLYLNDTFIAPGVAGPDGKITFSIQRGVMAGDYRVRLDEVAGSGGAVSTRAEVPFTMPAALQFAMPDLPPAATPLVTGPADAAPASGASAAAQAPSGAAAPGGPTAAPTPATPPASGAAPAAAAPSQAVASAQGGSPAPAAAPTSQPGTVVVPQVNTAVVVRGDSLWRISRRVYGRGVRYTVIYEANQDQIRNPQRIYPGQIFVLPGAEAGAAAAAPR